MNSLNSSILPSHAQRSTVSGNLDSRSRSSIQPLNKLNRATQEQKKSIAHIYTEQASIYFKEHNWRKAIIACKNALEIAPDCADAYKILGDILYRQGKQADALGVYAKALAIDPNLATVYANVGTMYAERQKWQKALDYYQQAVIIDPNLAGTYRNLAQVWEELGEGEKALDCFCQAVNLEPETLAPEEYFSFGKQLYQQGKVKEASILFTLGVKLNPQAKTELALLVKMLEELEEWEKAVSYYHQLISSSDRLNSAGDRKPIKKLLSKSRVKSNSSLKKVVANNPQKETSLLPQNVALMPSPKVDSANNTLAKLSPQKAQNSSTTVNVSALDKAPAPEPDSALSWNDLGSLYAQKQQWAKAISCYQEALQIDPNFAKSYRNLARVYSNLGETATAVLYWYEAFNKEPDLVKPEEYFTLAKKLLQHQEIDKAIACLRSAIQLKPDFDRAYLILGKLFESKGKLSQARACYSRLGIRD